MGLASAVRGLIRYEGLSSVVSATLDALKPLDFHIFVIRRGDPLGEVEPPLGVEMCNDALERLRDARRGATSLPNEFWRDKINNASICSLLTVSGEPASIIWIYPAPAKRPLIILAPTDAELSATYTLPKFRGRGFHRALLAFSTGWQLRERSRLFMVAAGDNLPSLKVIPEAGYKEVAVIRRRSIFGPKFSAEGMKAG
jgi:GNAT superfamily N-acetyltransferase